MNDNAKRTILLVEDEAIIAMTEKMQLEQYGYKAITASSGEKAIALLKENRGIDLILMDINLGKGLDGTEVAALILKTLDIPLVFLSSHTEQDVVAKTEMITSYGYVVKSSSITVLDACIKMAFKLFEAHGKLERSMVALRESEEKYRTIVENTSDSIMRYDREGRHIYGNPKALASMGVCFDEYIGKSHRDLGFPERLCALWDLSLEKVFQTGLSQTIEFDIEHPAGKTSLELLLSPEFNSDGSVNSIIGISRDITERRRIGEALRESEERYAKTLAAVNDGIWDWHVPSGKAFFSDLYYSILGYDTGDFPATYDSWRLLVHPEDLDGIERELRTCIDAGGGFNFDFRMKAKNGGWLWVATRGKTIEADSDRKAIRMVGTLSDITARKADEEIITMSETRYRRLFESAKDGIIILDAETGMIVDVNPFLIEMLGYSKEKFVEKAIWEIGFFKDIASNRANFLELQRNEYVRYEDLPLETAYGKVIEVEFVSNVYLVDKRKVIQCNIRDITERRRIERALEQLSREKRDLLSELQHRVKNSFSMICGMIGLASGDGVASETRAALDDIGSRVRSVSELYSLLYSSGSLNEVRLDDYCKRVVDSIIGFTNISLVAEMESIDVSVKEAAPIGLIVTELITNSVKYAFPGGRRGTITVNLKRTLAGARLEVRDDGIGLPPGFDISENAGLGLSLVRSLSEQVGGGFRMERGAEGTRSIVEFVSSCDTAD